MKLNIRNLAESIYMNHFVIYKKHHDDGWTGDSHMVNFIKSMSNSNIKNNLVVGVIRGL